MYHSCNNETEQDFTKNTIFLASFILDLDFPTKIYSFLAQAQFKTIGFRSNAPANPRNEVEVRMYPDLEAGLVKVRFWSKGSLAGVQKVKIEELPIVRF